MSDIIKIDQTGVNIFLLLCFQETSLHIKMQEKYNSPYIAPQSSNIPQNASRESMPIFWDFPMNPSVLCWLFAVNK